MSVRGETFPGTIAARAYNAAMERDERARRIDAVLPQTQCTRCGYADCAAYAEAIADGRAAIDRCPPGGDATIAALAAITGQPVVPPDPACGPGGPLEVAKIDEARCIGCTLCIAACPVDAIVGAAKRLHGVLAALCSGCALCVAPCPVDCIAMIPAARTWTRADADDARRRHRRLRARGEHRHEALVQADAARQRDAAIAAAIARARARRGAQPHS